MCLWIKYCGKPIFLKAVSHTVDFSPSDFYTAQIFSRSSRTPCIAWKPTNRRHQCKNRIKYFPLESVNKFLKISNVRWVRQITILSVQKNCIRNRSQIRLPFHLSISDVRVVLAVSSSKGLSKNQENIDYVETESWQPYL